MAKFWKSKVLRENTIVAICYNYITPQESIGLPYGIVMLRLSLKKVELHMNWQAGSKI